MGAARLVPLLLALSVACGRDDGEQPVVVMAASSTTDAMRELAGAYRAARVAPSFAASSTLARQIVHGAPADLFLCADAAWMDELERAGRIEPGTRVDLLGNRLVWVARGPDAAPPPACAGRLALADPEHVPAGRYARAALESLGWWESLAPRVVPAADVRHALRLVETGACAAGIVYATDAAAADVRVVATLPAESHPPVRYPAALVAGGDPRARAFLAWLRGPEAEAVFRRHGFLLPERNGP